MTSVKLTDRECKVLIVDDEAPVLFSLKRFLRRMEIHAEITTSPQKALQMLESDDYDIVISDMRMPGMDGNAFLTQAIRVAPDAIRVLVTGYSDVAALEKAINQAKIFGYVPKPWDENRLQELLEDAMSEREKRLELNCTIYNSQRSNLKLSRMSLLLDKKVKEKSIEVDQALGLLEVYQQKSEDNYFDSLNVLTQVLEWKEGRDSGHSRFVAQYGEKIIQRLDPNSDVREFRLAAMLHRIGTLYLPDELNVRPVFSFDAVEKNQYQQYPVWGALALSKAEGLQSISDIVRSHKEWVNGEGFPDQITDKDIPLASKIIAVTGDFFDLFNGRLERNISGYEDAISYIKEWSCKRYDKVVVDAFLDEIESFEFCSKHSQFFETVELNEGMILGADIRDHNNTLLLGKGMTINKSAIQHLRDYESQQNTKLQVKVLI